MTLFEQFVQLFPSALVELLVGVYGIFALAAPYWAPVLLVIVFGTMWKRYIRAKYISEIKWTLLEVKLPREILKTPRAMELVLHIFHQTRDGTWYSQLREGIVRQWFSLELVSIGGHVHFFIRTPVFFVKLIEAQIYSQYSDVEIHEVDDYTNYVNFTGDKDTEWEIFGTEYKLEKPDAYPIRTYIDYELDREVKEDTSRTDPITTLIEFLGSINHNEQVWIQFLIRAVKPRFATPGKMIKKRDWKDEGRDLIEKLKDKPGKVVAGGEGEDGYTVQQMLTPGERKIIEAIERGISKYGFDCGIRSIYLAKKGHFNDFNKPGLVNSLKQFNSEDMNGFKPNGRRVTDFDYPWQDFKNIRLNKRKRELFNSYRLRSYFNPPYQRHPFVLSVEELATVYHFPGSVAETPTFARIPSKTVEPPSNLPI